MESLTLSSVIVGVSPQKIVLHKEANPLHFPPFCRLLMRHRFPTFSVYAYISSSIFAAICIWRNANGAMPLRLALGLGLGLGIGLGSGFDYFRHCTICIAPNTESPSLPVV